MICFCRALDFSPPHQCHVKILNFLLQFTPFFIGRVSSIPFMAASLLICDTQPWKDLKVICHFPFFLPFVHLSLPSYAFSLVYALDSCWGDKKDALAWSVERYWPMQVYDHVSTFAYFRTIIRCIVLCVKDGMCALMSFLYNSLEGCLWCCIFLDEFLRQLAHVLVNLEQTISWKKNVFVFFLFRELDGLFLDYCRQRVCQDTMDKLFNLAEVRSLKLVDHGILTVYKLLVVSCIWFCCRLHILERRLASCTVGNTYVPSCSLVFLIP